MDVLSWNRSLTRELADRDAYQLLDIGVVRAADGSLRLATDPAVPAAPSGAGPVLARLAAPIRELLGEIRGALASTSVTGPALGHR